MSGGVGVPGGEGSALCWSPLHWPGDVDCVGGSGGGWLGAWIGGWLLEWRLGVAHGCEMGGAGDVGDWLVKGLEMGLRDCAEEGGLAELQGWQGGGFVGLGGAGACFLVPEIQWAL